MDISEIIGEAAAPGIDIQDTACCSVFWGY